MKDSCIGPKDVLTGENSINQSEKIQIMNMDTFGKGKGILLRSHNDQIYFLVSTNKFYSIQAGMEIDIILIILGNGGIFRIEGAQNSVTHIVNNYFDHNVAISSGGVLSITNSALMTITITDNIFLSNSATQRGVIFISSVTGESSLTLSNNNYTLNQAKRSNLS